MKKSLLMPINLQFFAEQDGGTQETTSTETTETTTDETKKEETGKTFSRDEVAKMIAAETKKNGVQKKMKLQSLLKWTIRRKQTTKNSNLKQS